MAARTTKSGRSGSSGARGAGDAERAARLLAALTAVRDGDFRARLGFTGDDGVWGEVATVFNEVVARNRALTAELARGRRVIGRDGRLGERVALDGASGAWAEGVESVNALVDDLVRPTVEMGRVLDAVADGDLTESMTLTLDGRQVRGEFRRIGRTVNRMVAQLAALADEVTRVAREVGTEGRLGGQAQVAGVSGSWRDLTESVNGMAARLTAQVRDIALVTTAVADGDLGREMTVEVQGEVAELKRTVNRMVAQLSSFADEVTRVAREVGTEGRLGGQADVPGVSGTWRDLTDSVNRMAGNLTGQVRDIARVATAVAGGDLSQKIAVEAEGEVRDLKDTVNTMVDTLHSFADEVTRVAREVGTEGRLGGQADVQGVSGTWKDLTESVNVMAANLTEQVRSIAQVTTAVAHGDLTQQITVDARGEVLALTTTVNRMVDQLSSFADEVTRVAREVGTEGRLGGQAQVRGASGTWRDLTDNVNSMAGNLTVQVRSIAAVATGVARGDLSQKITVEARGEVAALAQTINTMVDTLSAFADEVTRVAREVGTEGRLGGQARVPNVAGTWKDLTDNVNSMATNLTNQVRSIALVTTAVAEGDLSRKIDVDARGEILALKTTINTMVDQLSSFAAEVTRVAREVGSEGRLGGQAEVEGVAGTWQRLTESVNRLAGTLTTQLRAIAEVSTAVTRGDLSREITVDASGEVAELKDNINRMIGNLRETTRVNTEQDWLKTNLADITALTQGRRDLLEVASAVMSALTPAVSAQHGAFFFAESELVGRDGAHPGGPLGPLPERDEAAGEDGTLRLIASYGYERRKNLSQRFAPGEGLVGQAAVERKPILVTQAPPDYVRIVSGLGEAVPTNLVVLPVLFEERVLGVVELATVAPFTDVQLAFLEQLADSIGVSLNAVVTGTRTEELLAESQRLAEELQQQSEELESQQEELRQSNAELEQQAATLRASEEMLQQQQEELQHTNTELEEKASLLAEQNRAIEIKNSEIEQARRALEDRAEQLALSSKYKSEFLANMSHELRTPLNSLLILARLLSENADGNLTARQVEFASTIFTSGSDLLQLINDILDLSKVEAGKMDVTPTEVDPARLVDYVEATFRPLSAEKGLTLVVEVAESAPARVHTDEHRLQQVLRNLVSNAVKFTDEGQVRLAISGAPPGAAYTSPVLAGADEVVAFAVSDTGIGIPEERLRVVFEAFQQADGTTSRRYGGTGLGLSISREIARLLGGEIHVVSEEGVGTTFTLLLPARLPAEVARRATEEGPALGAPAVAAVAAGEGAERPGAAEARTPVGGDPAGGSAGALTAPEAGVPAQAGPAADGEEVVSGPPVAPQLLTEAETDDDRAHLAPGDRVLLVVLDDEELAATTVRLGRERGFKVVATGSADVAASAARDLRPDAVICGLDQVVSSGASLLDSLKRDPATRHIPTHVVAGTDAGERGRAAMQAGALAVLEPPVGPERVAETLAEITAFVDRRVRRLLVVEDDETERRAVTELVGPGEDVEVVGVGTAEEALAALEDGRFDCMVLDLTLPGTDGFRLLEEIEQRGDAQALPVIVYTGRELSRQEETRLRRYAESIIVKDARSPERLLDETALFLHRVEGALPPGKRQMIEHLRDDEDVFRGKRVLIVDDDVRNVFALTSALEQHGIEVRYAENGREGIEELTAHPDTDLVLMDVMMPEMDGYATTRAVREMPQFARLPVIALTAKAMKGDRERSIAAGASDYVTKPVDVAQLLSLMRVWLYP